MPFVEALDSFEHNGPHKRGHRFNVSPQVARKLRDAGLVAVVGEGNRQDPRPAAGSPQSASQAARVSPQTTSTKSAGGGKRRRKKSEALS